MKWSTYVGLFCVIFVAGVLLGVTAFVTNEIEDTLEEGFQQERPQNVDHSNTIRMYNM
ncbi:hypothetical protein SAMN05216238_101405 [Lentibacillus persicus]|uniref:Uncharacterized protein n=1 Tax=Lentibacillus persicus TaxID=640948 RepID=A0A1I1SKS9_9BACI|nr:hypothetical protein [Lentibacillus persicus]SFD45278.1 hypothetical protein SAMN05216238_101405 [Lentibacillus persicus]